VRGFLWNYLEKSVARMEKLLEGIDTPKIERGGGFRVLSYQLPFEPLLTVEDALRFVEGRMRDISKYAPSVVSFPRYFGNFFMGLVPFSGKKLATDKGVKIVESYGTIFRSAYISVLRKVATAVGATVVGGTILLPGDEEEYYIVSERGDVISSGTIRSVYRIFKCSDVLCAFFFPEELRSYEKVRKVMEEGVRIVFSVETHENFSEWEMRKGLWARSQSLGIFGVNSALTGEFLGRKYRGISFVSAPALLTRRFDGFVVRLLDPDGKGLAIADLDVSTLEGYIESLPKTYKRWTLGVR